MPAFQSRSQPRRCSNRIAAVALVALGGLLLGLLLPLLARAATEPPDLVAPVAGEIRVRIKRGPSAAQHSVTLFVDRVATRRMWDERHPLPRLSGPNDAFDTGIKVQPGDMLDLELEVNNTLRVLYTTGRNRRNGDPEPRVIAPDGRRCGDSRAGEPPLDISDFIGDAEHLIACSCWEDATDFDFNDFAMCVDYTPDSVPTPTATATLTVTLTPTPTLTLTPTSTPVDTDTPTPSATPTATDTPIPSPSATPTPTASTTPTATPTRVPQPAYLPLALKQQCIEVRTAVDAAIVIDLSTSMRQPAGDGRPKLDAAIEAAGAFLGALALAPDATGRYDRAAVIGFNATAWTAQGISRDRAALDGALAGLPARVSEGTRLDLALEEARAALGRDRRSADVAPVVVVLTDGLPNQVPTPLAGGTQEDTVLAAAAALRQAGARVFTIGLGEERDVPRGLLERVASRLGDYFFAPGGADLVRIYREVAKRSSECRSG